MEAELDLSVLDAITDAVESGAGLHEVVRAASRALDASLVLTDRGGGTVAVAVQSPADEAAVKADGDGVEAYGLRVADEPVGTLRVRSRSVPPGPALLRLVTTLIASEVERVRAPERASQAAASAFVQRLFDREQASREAVQSGAEQVGLALDHGATVLVVRAHSLAAAEALLAANVAESDPERPLLAFDETGAYRLLLPAMSEDPAELQRFYAETVEPLVAYDEQYETELVSTLETFLDADGNVAGTAARLFTHRHTIRYRLERVRELSGLDVGSTDGREKLSLGLKAMRVLGIATRGGPAREAGAEGGRVPRR